MMYGFLANVCVVLHLAVILFIMVGFFIPDHLPRFVVFHRLFMIATFLLGCLFGDCPLTLLEKYLRAINNPSSITHEPFTTRFIRETFNISIPEITVTVTIILLVILSLISLISLLHQKQTRVPG